MNSGGWGVKIKDLNSSSYCRQEDTQEYITTFYLHSSATVFLTITHKTGLVWSVITVLSHADRGMRAIPMVVRVSLC